MTMVAAIVIAMIIAIVIGRGGVMARMMARILCIEIYYI